LAALSAAIGDVKRLRARIEAAGHSDAMNVASQRTI
jgi:hypothetical protein